MSLSSTKTKIIEISCQTMARDQQINEDPVFCLKPDINLYYIGHIQLDGEFVGFHTHLVTKVDVSSTRNCLWQRFFVYLLIYLLCHPANDGGYFWWEPHKRKVFDLSVLSDYLNQYKF